MRKKKPASIYTGLRIPPELRMQAEDRARQDGRTLSNYIKHLIREDLAETEVFARHRVNYSSEKRTQPTVITDRNGRVTSINREFTKMCGYTLQELRGKTPGEMLRPKTESGEKDTIRDFRKAIRAIRPFSCTLTNYDKKNALYHVHIQMRPIFEGSEHIGFEAVERRLD